MCVEGILRDTPESSYIRDNAGMRARSGAALSRDHAALPAHVARAGRDQRR